MKNDQIIRWCIYTCCCLLAACAKDGLIDRTAPAGKTRLMFIHAVPEAIQFNFFSGHTKLTAAIPNASTEQQQGMGYNTANQPSYFGYLGIAGGAMPISAILPQDYGVGEKDTLYAGASVLDTSFIPEENNSYTIAAFGTAKSVTSLILKDSLIAADSCGGIRFINLMPGTVVVDLQMTYTPPNGDAPVTSLFAEKIAYGGATGFKALKPGNYVFQRKRTGTQTNVGSALSITRLKTGQNFTLCARGTLAAMLQVPHE